MVRLNLTNDEIQAYIIRMKAGEKMYYGITDPDPYGGGAKWDYKLGYDKETNKFYLQTDFCPSQYNEPEISVEIIEEDRLTEILLTWKKNSFSCR